MSRRPSGIHVERAGFSLVETLIAMTVLAVTLLGTLRSQVTSNNLLRESQETEVATALLQTTMSELATIGFEELTGAGGTHEPGVPLTVETPLQNQVLVYTIPEIAGGGPVPDVVSIRVTLTWTSRTGIDRTLDLVDARRP